MKTLAPKLMTLMILLCGTAGQARASEMQLEVLNHKGATEEKKSRPFLCRFVRKVHGQEPQSYAVDMSLESIAKYKAEGGSIDREIKLTQRGRGIAEEMMLQHPACARDRGGECVQLICSVK